MWRLNKTDETIQHDENDDIPAFHLEQFDVGLELKNSPNEVGFIDVQYGAAVELYSAIADPALAAINFEPIEV